MATFTDQLRDLFDDYSDEGPTSLCAALLAEIERVRDAIVVESGWDGFDQIVRADRAIEIYKSYLAGDASLEDYDREQVILQKAILALGAPHDQRGRAVFHYQLACAELPSNGDWEGTEGVIGDLLCFLYLWYPDIHSHSAQRKLLERLRYTLESRTRRLSGVAYGTRLRNSLLAT